MSPNTVFDAVVVGGSDDTTLGKLDNLLDGLNNDPNVIFESLTRARMYLQAGEQAGEQAGSEPPARAVDGPCGELLGGAWSIEP